MCQVDKERDTVRRRECHKGRDMGECPECRREGRVTGVRARKEGGWKEGRKNEVRPQRAGCAKFGF